MIEQWEFERYLALTQNDSTAAAILYLADTLHIELKDFDHQIALGITHGLNNAKAVHIYDTSRD